MNVSHNVLGRLIASDAKQGFPYLKVPILLAAVTACWNLFDAYYLFAFAEQSTAKLTFGDNLCLILGAQPPFDFRPGLFPTPPYGWILLMTAGLYSCSRFPKECLSKTGQTTLIQSGSRTKWLCSKMLWLLLSSICYFAVLGCVAFLWTALHGQAINLNAHAESFWLLQVSSDHTLFAERNVWPFLASAFLGYVALVSLQLLVSLLANQSVAFLLSFVQIVLASLSQNPLLLGNALISARWGGMVANGISHTDGVTIPLACIALTTLTALSYFKRSDILNEKQPW